MSSDVKGLSESAGVRSRIDAAQPGLPEQRFCLHRLVIGLIAAAATAIWFPALGAPSPGADFEASVGALARSWDYVNYDLQGADRVQQAADLAARADALARRFPGRAEPLVWKALAYSTEADADGGLAALRLVRQARATLEAAERIDPQAMGDASVYTSLGALYYLTPGFPVGFGDKAKARAYLQKALAQNPTGIDPNYFYGDFLHRQGDDVRAEQALERAIAAPPRPGREIADHGRRAEAQDLLAKVRRGLAVRSQVATLGSH